VSIVGASDRIGNLSVTFHTGNLLVASQGGPPSRRSELCGSSPGGGHVGEGVEGLVDVVGGVRCGDLEADAGLAARDDREYEGVT
jgi:hypothetical protein